MRYIVNKYVDKVLRLVYCKYKISYENSILLQNLLFRVVEVHRTGEATATPDKEGAYLSEFSNRTIRGFDYRLSDPLIIKRFFLCTDRCRGSIPLRRHMGRAASRVFHCAGCVREEAFCRTKGSVQGKICSRHNYYFYRRKELWRNFYLLRNQ